MTMALKTYGKFVMASLISTVLIATVAYAQIYSGKDGTAGDFAIGNGARALEGAWDVTVTLRNCADGSEIRSFPRLNTFMQGGTMQETAASGTSAQPALRSPGHGIWQHYEGRSFGYSIKFLRLNADGSPAGFVRESRSVEVSPMGGMYTATGSSVIYLPNGVVLGPFCSTEEGAKIGIE